MLTFLSPLLTSYSHDISSLQTGLQLMPTCPAISSGKSIKVQATSIHLRTYIELEHTILPESPGVGLHSIPAENAGGINSDPIVFQEIQNFGTHLTPTVAESNVFGRSAGSDRIMHRGRQRNQKLIVSMIR